MASTPRKLEIVISDEAAGRISKEELLRIFQQSIENGDITAEDNKLYFVACVLPLIDQGLLRPSRYTDALEQELAESARNLAHRARNGVGQSGGSDFSVVDAAPGYPNYFLPGGIALAYGIFERGFLTHWAIEGVVFSVLWGIRGPVFKSWTYRAYSVERQKLGLAPNPIVFAVLQAATTAIFVFAVVFLVRGAKRLLGYDAPY